MKPVILFFLSLVIAATVYVASATAAVNSGMLKTAVLVDPTRPDHAAPTEPLVKPKLKKKKKKKQKNPIKSLSLQQTLVSQNRKIAVINGKRMTIGKTIRGAKLVRINFESVELIYRGKRYTLSLTSPSDIKEVKR